MKAKYLIAIAAVMSIVTVWSCKKLKEQIHSGYAAGRLFYSPPEDPDKEPVFLANARIKLSNTPADLVNYQRSVITDKEGYFTIDQLAEEVEYVVFFDDSINHVSYFGQAQFKANKEDVEIIATPRAESQNRIAVKVTGPSGDPVGTATVCLFNNETAWKADTCLGSLQTISLLPDGTASLYNIEQGTYFFYASALLNKQWYRGRLKIEVGADGVTPADIVLQSVDVNRLDVLVVDPAGDPVGNLDVCVFNNQTSWNTNNCSNGSIMTLKADSAGKAFRTNVPSGLHYLLVSTTINDVLHRAKTQLDIPATGTASATLTLQPVTDTTTGFKVKVIDAFGTPVNGAQVCVFTNSTLFQADTCQGNVFEIQTGLDGVATKTHIAEGKYYLRTTLQIGNVKLKSMDSVIVNPLAITMKTVTAK
jgi:hypothetical protein